MKLRLIAPFDTRATVGLDDAAFAHAPQHRPSGADVEVTLPTSQPGFGTENPLGRGLQITLGSRHPLESWWRSRAANHANKCIGEVRGLEPTRRASVLEFVGETLANQPMTVRLTALAVGVGLLEAEYEVDLTALFDATSSAFAIVLLYRSLEHAAYFESTSRELLDIVHAVAEDLGLHKSPLSHSARRGPPLSLPWPFDPSVACSNLFGAFTLCVIPGAFEGTRVAQRTVELLDDTTNPPRFSFGNDGVLVYGWAAMAALPQGSSEEERKLSEQYLLQLIHIAHTHLEANRITERLLTERLTLAMDNLGRNTLDGRGLATLRALACSVPERTSTRAVTLRADARAFLDHFAKAAKLDEYHASIFQKGSTLYEVYRDLLLDQEARRARKISLLLASIAILTVASVASDLLGSVDFAETFLTDSVWRRRAIWLTAPTAFLVFVLGALTFGPAFTKSLPRQPPWDRSRARHSRR